MWQGRTIRYDTRIEGVRIVAVITTKTVGFVKTLDDIKKKLD